MDSLWMAIIGGGGATGALLLRRAWGARGSDGGPWKWLGWVVMIATFAVAMAAFGSMRGLFIAFSITGVAALAVVASGYELRQRRERKNRSLAPEPIERASTWWRGVLRWLLALPIGLIAAMGIGIFYTAWTGGAPQTRLVVGGLLIPVVWGACMAWTLADNRILRALAFLVAVTAFGFGLAIVRGF
ncbi:hypothetical protein [Sphingosinithalassobacter sp. LHW66-3]|uniref:hypothetical protein n=1 Tax=Sphingosinithalassobacter sp. LHW66-3 TaxID=3424718 RepID=UPI003D6C06DF